MVFLCVAEQAMMSYLYVKRIDDKCHEVIFLIFVQTLIKTFPTSYRYHVNIYQQIYLTFKIIHHRCFVLVFNSHDQNFLSLL